jgi:hypothetical protein
MPELHASPGGAHIVTRLSPGLPRRIFLQRAAALTAAGALCPSVRAADKPIINPPALLDSEAGGYRVLPAGQVFCGGVIPVDGFEVVHALFTPWVPLKDAWSRIEQYLKSVGRPVQALCGMELRIPAQLTLEGFRAFNQPYVQQLRNWDLVIGNYSAVCRTNVAPALEPPKEPSVHAFSFTAPTQLKSTTFCISGTADIDSRGRIVAEGDVSLAGMRQRLQHCLDTITERLAELGVGWDATTHVDLCCARELGNLMEAVVVPGVQGAAAHGIRLHHARPPILGAEVELECRAVRREITLAA